MIKILRDLGITSDVAYLAAVAPIGASPPGEKADRWGIYVGRWAPTFMALGNAIKVDESR